VADIGDIKGKLERSARAASINTGRKTYSKKYWPKGAANIAKACRECGGTSVACRDSRPAEIGDTVVTRRRWHCAGCEGRWTTYEVRDDDFSRMVAAADASDGAAQTRMLAAIIKALGIPTAQIIEAMAVKA
jgi:hypothetical protein